MLAARFKQLNGPVLIILLVWLLSFALLLFKTVPVSGDGIYYFSYLRSAVIDHDLDFENELEHFAEQNIHVKKQLDSGVKTTTGLTHNLFSVGPAIMWLPFYAVGRMFALAIGQTDGYTFIELLSISMGTAVYGLFGLLLSFSLVRAILRKKYQTKESDWIAACSTLAVFLGSNLFFYTTFDTSGSHVLGFFGVSLLLWLWWRWRDSKVFWHWLVIGTTGGLLTMIRWQLLGVFIVLPVLDFLINILRQRKAGQHQGGQRSLNQKIIQGTLLVSGFLIAVVPQMLAWKTLYGNYLTIPQGRGFLDLSSPHFFEVLLSNRHGLFIWTPLFVLSLTGLLFAAFRKIRWAIYALLILLVQAYINGTAIEWWGGEAFGPRRFTDISAVFILGLAILLAWAWPKYWTRYIFYTLVLLLVVLNVLQMQVYRLGLIPLADSVGWPEFFQAIGNYLHNLF